ncbi:snRNA-activating protein of 50kDa MW C terminal-domain-containing protein [Chlamydoabsidia padenii]|nr:snRNA-activating protein of 50kDa MW C terminal-domain-containing protein [Chlamydoabsidia padenii]
MVTRLDQSSLRTIKKKYLLEVPPRLRMPYNYAILRQNDDNNDSNNSNSKRKKNTRLPKKKHPSSTSEQQSIKKRPRYKQHQQLIFAFSIYQAHLPSKKLQDFNLLGSQTLTDVRDAIYCRMDFSAHGDREDRQPDGKVINTLHQKLSPSFFYIENTFYSDQRRGQRQPNIPVRQWLMEQQCGDSSLPPNQQDMNSVALRDMTLELNRPYLFDHQDHCQHVVMVRDIRLLESSDEQDPDKYPVVTYSWRYTRYKCTMCMIYPAVYVTTNDYLSGFSPCYFCERCHRPFHFDENGDPVTTFNIYTYHGT